MTSIADLPTNWTLDFPIKGLIPKANDWRSFKRIPFAPRYAASITGQGVYDLKRREFLSPIIDTRKDSRGGRVRYRLVTAEPEAGKRNAVKKPYYASIILTLTEGERRTKKTQAHHQDHDRTNDHWANLSWVTAKANRRMAAEHMRGSRAGSANPRANKALSGEVLAHFIAFYDRERRERGHVDLKPYAQALKMTVDQLRRIATGKSRTAEVQAIRAAQQLQRQQQARQEFEAAKHRRRSPHTYPTEQNPFHAAYDDIYIE